MTWLDDRIEQRTKASTEDRLIAQSLEPMYEALWEKVVFWIDEARKNGIELLTNGAAHERIVKLPVKPRATQSMTHPKQLTISLDRSKHAIVASGPRTKQVFTVTLRDGTNIARLTHDGIEVSPDKAAEMILDPLIFPEFYAGSD